ncbi:hypothetical protein V6N13_030882 [Hibiscus sabdariffa]|uniref:Clp R domain-containing protein n=1 Tax=Hibiscus sabdariffa TaxID=183260 RepID=A0ABR2D6J0_9ROSI
MTARVGAQSALLTGHGHGHGPSNKVENPKWSVKTAYGLRTPLLRMRSDSDNKMVRFGSSPTAISSAKEAKFEGLSEKSIKVIILARGESRRHGHNYIGTEQILLGLIGEGTGIAAKVLKSMGIKLIDARKQVAKTSPRGSGCFAVGFSFTSLASAVLVHSLEEARKRGHNSIEPEHLLLGLLRQRVARGVLKDLGTDSSNIYKQVIRMVGEGDVIRIATERSICNTKVPTLEGYGTNLAKLVEERLGATRLDEYNEHIEKDPEPSVDEAILLLKRVQEHYEIHHKLCYSDEALIAAAELSYRFISDRRLPDKAIDLIHEAGVRVCACYEQFLEATEELRSEFRQIIKSKNEPGHSLRMKELRFQIGIFHAVNNAEKVVTEVDIEDIVSSWTGIPVEMVITDESDRLVKLEEILHKRVVGQDEAVKAVSRACVGLRNLNQPIASFIFYGPNGVGKSELAKALAANYFGSEEAVIQLDRSELVDNDAASRLIGSQPGQLTEAVRRRPYTVVLFDEVCYAYPSVLDMIVQILEHGRLADGKGRIVDFRNTLLILTTNGGRPVIEDDERQMGFDLDEDRSKSLVMEEMEEWYGPKFANRFDEVIVFRQLTKLEVKEIADKKLNEVSGRLKAKEIQLRVTEKFRQKVSSNGAWPLCSAIRHLEDDMAEKMVSREIKEGDLVTVDVDSDGNVVILNGSSDDL